MSYPKGKKGPLKNGFAVEIKPKVGAKRYGDFKMCNYYVIERDNIKELVV